MSWYFSALEKAANPTNENDARFLIDFTNFENDELKKSWVYLSPKDRTKAIIVWVHDHVKTKITRFQQLSRGLVTQPITKVLTTPEHNVEGDCKEKAVLYVALARASGLKEPRFVFSPRIYARFCGGHVWAETKVDDKGVWFHIDPSYGIFGVEYYDCKCHWKGSETWLRDAWMNRKFYRKDPRFELWDLPIVIAEIRHSWREPVVEYEFLSSQY